MPDTSTKTLTILGAEETLVTPQSWTVCLEIGVLAQSNAVRAMGAALGATWRRGPNRVRTKYDADNLSVYGSRVLEELRGRGIGATEFSVVGREALDMIQRAGFVDPEKAAEELGNSEPAEGG